jgi:hypothetical protein
VKNFFSKQVVSQNNNRGIDGLVRDVGLEIFKVSLNAFLFLSFTIVKGDFGGENFKKNG